MNYEELLKHIVGHLKKLGVDVKFDEESINSLTDKNIADSVLSNKTFTKELIESATNEAKKEVESTIINKLEKQAKELGVDVSDAKGDVKTIMGMVDKHLKTELGKSEDEKSEKLTQIQKQLQEAKISLDEKTKLLEDKETEFANTLSTTKSKIEQTYNDHSIFASLPLTEAAKKNSRTFFERLIAPDLEGYTQNENGELSKDGKPVFKNEILGGDKTLDVATRKDLIEAKAKEYNYIKDTDTSTKPATPDNTRRQPDTGGVRKVDNYNGL